MGAKRKRGTCHVCGCQQERACPGGCAWTDSTHTLCTACAEPRCGNCGTYAIDRIGPMRAKTVREVITGDRPFIPVDHEATHGRIGPGVVATWRCPLCLGKAVA